MERYDAIYGRQSVDRADSISIESQIEYCRRELRDAECRIFTDKGYSGRNTERPQFQAMMEAMRRGELARVIVYKLDRISRSILDFATMMDGFQAHGVEFVSCTEKFDTSTPMGRAMLNICIVFAQLERETIQMRVEDAYVSRSRRGFYMGGRVPYGYRLEPHTVDGKRTSRYAAEPDEADVVRRIFGMYAEPQTSFGDVVRRLTESGVTNARAKNGAWDRGRLAEMIKNPIYVRADLDIYRFYTEQGTVVHNGPEDFIGVFGCYLYADRDAGRKQTTLAGQHVVLAPHEGLVPSDVWLRARRKCMGNRQAAKPLKAKNTWLAGKIKCEKCGYALTVRRSKTQVGRYLVCSRRMRTGDCDGVGGLNAGAAEALVLQELRERLRVIPALRPPSERREDPRRAKLYARLAQVSSDMEKLMDKIADADEVVMKYVTRRIHELDALAASLHRELEALEAPDGGGAGALTDYMARWEALSFDDRRAVVELLIGRIRAGADGCVIEWRI